MKHHDKMLTYYDAGFRHILPIVPPGADISSLSKQLPAKPEMLGKVPGLLREDGWVGFPDWATYETDRDDVKRWSKWNCGFGLRCVDVIALDVDVTDEDLTDLIISTVHAITGHTAIRTGNAPKALMLFRAEPAGWLTTKRVLKFTDFLDDKHMVEVLGSRQQFVVEGIHPKTGKPYVWNMSPADVGIETLPVLTEDMLDEVLDAISKAVEQEGCTAGGVEEGNSPDARDFDGLKCSDKDLLRRMVMTIPNNDDTPREFFIKVAHAVFAASVDDYDEGLDIFKAWADKRPSGQADGEPERVYASVKKSGVGIQWITEQARANGFSEAIAADFEFDEEAPPKPFEEWSPNEEDSPHLLWNQFVYVNQLKRFVCLRNDAELDKEQFNDRHKDPSSKDSAVDLFMEHRRPHSFADTVTYMPGVTAKVVKDKGTGEVKLNRWRPGPAFRNGFATVTEDDIKPWLDLGKHLFPNKTERDILTKWCAALLQQPGVKPNWHPLVGSDIHGTGKDSWIAPLTYGLGRENVSVIRSADLESDWTWWAENVQLVIVSEIATFERKAVMNRLISFMATPPDTIDINKKYTPVYTVPNIFGMMMFTNDNDSVAIKKHDRRFFVVWSDAGKLSPDWYENYHKWLVAGGRDKILAHLLSLDLSDFNLRGNAPHTQAKEDMRKAAMSTVEGTIESAIEHLEGPFERDLFTMGDVELWLRSKSINSLNPNRLSSLLRRANCANMGRTRLDSGQVAGIWCCRRFETYNQLAQEKGLTALRDRMLSDNLDSVANEFESKVN